MNAIRLLGPLGVLNEDRVGQTGSVVKASNLSHLHVAVFLIYRISIQDWVKGALRETMGVIMTGDQYLLGILARETVDTGPNSTVRGVHALLRPMVKEWADDKLLAFHPSGSFIEGHGHKKRHRHRPVYFDVGDDAGDVEGGPRQAPRPASRERLLAETPERFSEYQGVWVFRRSCAWKAAEPILG